MNISNFVQQATKRYLQSMIYLKRFSKSSSLDKVIEVKDQDDFFVKIMRSSNPVIVNFHANWCEPCHILTPKLTELLSDKDDIDLVTIDVEAHAELAHIFEVKAIPAVLAFKDGHVIDKSIGLIDANAIDKLFDNVIKK